MVTVFPNHRDSFGQLPIKLYTQLHAHGEDTRDACGRRAEGGREGVGWTGDLHPAEGVVAGEIVLFGAN